jgi:DNA-binding transcriptional ArsR family regulator
VSQSPSDPRAPLDPRLLTVTELLMEYGHQMIRLRVGAVPRGAPGYGVIAVRAMIRLGLVGPMSMGDLATSLSVSPARATQIVDVLERAGRVERRRSDRDRRVWQIRLKPEPAAQVLDDEFGRPVAALRQAWSQVPEGCRDVVLDFVRALVDGMRAGQEPCGAGATTG